MIYNFSPLPLFDAWLGFSGAIPDIYWNVYSEEQRYKFLCKRVQMLIEYAEQLGITLNASNEAIQDLYDKLENLKENFAEEFEDYYKATICEWINNQLVCIIGSAVRFVQFGLTDDGHFIATIPNNWDFLQFKTDMDLDSPDFGKLQIVY